MFTPEERNTVGYLGFYHFLLPVLLLHPPSPPPLPLSSSHSPPSVCQVCDPLSLQHWVGECQGALPETAHSGNQDIRLRFQKVLRFSLRKKFTTDVGFAGHGTRKDVPYVWVGTVSAARGAGEAGDEEC